MKRRSILVSILFGITLLTGCNWFGGNPSTEQQAQGGPGGKGESAWGKPEKPKFKMPVTVETIERGRMYAYLQSVGTVVPIKELEIKPEMTGRIYFSKRWMEGDEVKKGQVFATIDDRQTRMDINEAQLQLQLAEAAVRPASAQLSQAMKDEEFKKAMYERGAISKAEYDLAALTRIQRENAYEQALQNIKSRKMSVSKMEQELEKVEIILPFDGVLLPERQSVSANSTNSSAADLTVSNNQMVGASTVLCRLANIDQVYVSLDVPAKDLMQVEIGQAVELEIYSRAGNEYRGIVADISTSLNANTRTYTVNVLVDNSKKELRPGMFAKARIITQEKLDAIKLPRSMIQLRNNRDVVFVVKPKPQNDVKSATGEFQLRRNEQENKQLVMAGSGNMAFAAERIESGTAIVTPGSEDFDNPTEIEEIEYIAEERVIRKGIENREEVEVLDGLRQGELLVVLGYETLTDGVAVSVTFREKGGGGIEDLLK